MSLLANKYRNRQSYIFIKLFCIISAFVVVLNFLVLYKYLDRKYSHQPIDKADATGIVRRDVVTFRSRKLLNVTERPKTTQDIGDYPQDLLTIQQKKNGWIVLHCIGVLYMFLGLAIICDEFFVPALHVITHILKISDDVAGATFMAAGGSAPELFTSIIGVFFSDTQVGIGTIVGSAVFNVLFVIGMCAMFSKTLLSLTWWPLLRDSLFYIVALILLIAFFSDGAISWHEALGLFIVYIAYVLFMMKNGKIEAAVKTYIAKKTRASSVTPIIDEKSVQGFFSFPTVLAKNAFRNGAIQLVIHTLDPIAETGVQDKFQKIKDHYDTISTKDETTKDASSSLLDDKDLADHPMMPSPNRSQSTILHEDFPQRRVSSAFNQQQKHESIEMQNTNLRHPMNNSMDTINGSIINTDLDKSVHDMGSNTKTNGNNNDFSNYHHPHGVEQGSQENMNSRPNSAASFTHDGNHNRSQDIDGASTRTSVRFSSRRLSRCSSRASCRSHRGLSIIKKESPVADEGDAEDADNLEDEDEGPLDLSWPDNNLERIFYLIKAPLLFLLLVTVPDVRRPSCRKLFPLTFVFSILWIAIFSYLMLWWASEIGRTAGIDVEIMGLTFIAAGTSIPDLITSVVVARQGLGDMAVSSSIGSNIFDVTVGLPVPWFAYSMSTSFKDVIVKNSGLFCSTILLFLMLVAVVITIGFNKWKMTKTLGGSMFGLYVVFITLTLLLQLNVLSCPFG